MQASTSAVIERLRVWEQLARLQVGPSQAADCVKHLLTRLCTQA